MVNDCVEDTHSWLGPTAHDRFRPLTYYTQLPLAARMDGGNRNSFYSGYDRWRIFLPTRWWGSVWGRWLA